MLICDNPFWQFSLAVYARPGVADECLALQKHLNIDVNVLLCCAWIGNAYKVRLGDEQLQDLGALILAWQRTVVRPLRAARQDIKQMPSMSETAVKDLRQDIACLELRAEQIEQAMLFEFARGLVTGATVVPLAEAVRHNIANLLRLAGLNKNDTGTGTSHAERLIAETIGYRPEQP